MNISEPASERAERGELTVRRLGDEWRLSKLAVLACWRMAVRRPRDVDVDVVAAVSSTPFVK